MLRDECSPAMLRAESLELLHAKRLRLRVASYLEVEGQLSSNTYKGEGPEQQNSLAKRWVGSNMLEVQHWFSCFHKKVKWNL